MKNLNIVGSGDEISVGKIICVGRNYLEHAKEMGAVVPEFPVLFLKPPSAIIRSGEPIIRPRMSHSLHYEVELVVAIGSGGKNISSAAALEHVRGYAVGLDMTLRDVQNEAKQKGLPWTVAKGFDTSAPISEIIPSSEVADPKRLHIRCTVNGTVRQETSVASMIFPVEQLIEQISGIFSLEPGDLIFTGTPAGVGEVGDGDTIIAELVGLTSTAHPVRVSAS